MGGTKLSNIFTAYIPRGMERDKYYILLAHEMMHSWIGRKICNNQDEEINYWWTEGFTDFYTRLVAYRSGAIDQDLLINEINKFLQSYYLSLVNLELSIVSHNGPPNRQP